MSIRTQSDSLLESSQRMPKGEVNDGAVFDFYERRSSTTGRDTLFRMYPRKLYSYIGVDPVCDYPSIASSISFSGDFLVPPLSSFISSFFSLTNSA